MDYKQGFHTRNAQPDIYTGNYSHLSYQFRWDKIQMKNLTLRKFYF